MTDPATVTLLPSSFCWVTPENVVGMATGREIMGETKTAREGRREGKKERKTEEKNEREGERERGQGAS